MTMKPVVPGLHIIPGLVNVYLLETPEGDALIDTGFPNSEGKILAAIASIGKGPRDVRHIVLTHGHPDHIGSAAALKRATGATVYAHAEDVPVIEDTTLRRPMTAAPGLRNRIMTTVLMALRPKVEPVEVDHQLADGQKLPFAGDVSVVLAPGHCAGQLALLWDREGGLLFAADSCINRGRLQLAAAQEDVALALSSLGKLLAFDFEIACFGHGAPIMTRAALEFRSKWPALAPDFARVMKESP